MYHINDLSSNYDGESVVYESHLGYSLTSASEVQSSVVKFMEASFPWSAMLECAGFDFLWIWTPRCLLPKQCLQTWQYDIVIKQALILNSEKAMAPHSSTLAWKIPWTEEPDGLQSMGSLRVRHDWATSLSLFTFMLWRRKWQPTPVFLPGESQGRGSLVGCRLWGRTESDTSEVT